MGGGTHTGVAGTRPAEPSPHESSLSIKERRTIAQTPNSGPDREAGGAAWLVSPQKEHQMPGVTSVFLDVPPFPEL